MMQDAAGINGSASSVTVMYSREKPTDDLPEINKAEQQRRPIPNQHSSQRDKNPEITTDLIRHK